MAQRQVIAIAQVVQGSVQQRQRLNRRHARPGAWQQAGVCAQPCIIVQRIHLYP